MTTSRDDIDGLINGLNVYAEHAMPCYPNDICSIAATQLAALSVRVKELEGNQERVWCTACGTVTRDKECDCTIHELSCGEPNFVNYADAMRKEASAAHASATRLQQELDAMNDNHRVMARQMADLGRALIKAEQDRDEAIAALKPFVDVAEEMLSRGWDASNVALALDNPNEPHRVTAGDFFAIRRLAGPEKEGE